MPTQCDVKPLLLPRAVEPSGPEPSPRSVRRKWSKPPSPPTSKGEVLSPLKTTSPPQKVEASRPSARRKWVKPTSAADIPVPIAETESDDRRGEQA